MSVVTAALVKELREKSGAGMMDCKKALVEANGDIEAAVDWLRKKGLAAAAKKSSRVASEGLIGCFVRDNVGVLVEVNSETDFVSRNEHFQNFINDVGSVALDAKTLDELKEKPYPNKSHSVQDELTELIAKIGENLTLRRFNRLEVSQGVVASYCHNAVTDGLGKIGVLAALESEGDQAKLLELGKQISMHIAATNPQSLSVDDLDQELVERERSVVSEQAKASGKPDNIVEKMVEGRLKKYYQEVVLLEQTFVVDNETQIKKVIEQEGKNLNTSVELKQYSRFALGEGVEKEESDFAAEVAAQLAS